jgi:hypothetical protein
MPNPTPSYTPSAADDSGIPETTGIPVIRQRIEETGYVSTSFSVSAGYKLRIRFTPGIQDKNVAGTGFTPNYSKLGVYITVGSLTQPTPMLSNGFQGGDAQSSHIMDFSQAISAGCSGGGTACRQDVTITVSKPNNDYWCLNWGQYCPYAHVYESHPWNGVLEIETDDTEALQ